MKTNLFIPPGFYKILVTMLLSVPFLGFGDEYQSSMQEARKLVVDGLLEDLPAAEKQYQNALRLKPKSVEAHIEYAQLIILKIKLGLEQIVSFDKAMGMISQAQDLDPTNPESQYALAEILLSLDKKQEAYQVFMSTVESFPEHLYTKFYKARFLVEADPEMSLSQANEAIEGGASLDLLSPYMVAAIRALSQSKPNPTASEVSLFEKYSMDYKNRWFYHHLALAYQDQSETLKAKDSFLKAIKKGNKIESNLQLAILEYSKLSAYQQAIQRLTKLKEDLKKRPNLRPATLALVEMNMALAFFTQKDLESSNRHLKESLNLSAKNPEMMQFIFEEYKKINALSELIEPLEAVSTRVPQLVTPHLLLAQVYDQKNQYQKAIHEIKKALKISPKDDQLYSHLAILQMKNLDDENALDSFDQAIKINPKSFVYFYNRACVLTRMNKYQLALNDLKSAYAINPDVPTMIENDPDLKALRDHPTYSKDIKFLSLTPQVIQL